MNVERIRISENEPFRITDLVDHCRTNGIPEFEPELARMGLAAATELEAYAGIALLDQTIRVMLDGWPRSAWLTLPVAPLLDPLSVAVLVDGEPFEGYAVVTGQRPALRLSAARPSGCVEVEYQAGYGATADDIPRDLALAIMDQVAATYDTRGLEPNKTNGMSPQMARIAARYRRVAL